MQELRVGLPSRLVGYRTVNPENPRKVLASRAMLDRAKAPARGQRFLRDAKVQGLALRISRGGAKSWVWEGRVRGRVR